MEGFVNKLDPLKFRKTNTPWNNLMLNDPWSVGYVTTLITLKNFQSKEEWENFYYQMGEIRNRRLEGLKSELKDLLNDEQLILRNRDQIRSIEKALVGINTKNGRTREDLIKKGNILYKEINLKHPEISREECAEAVRYRVICETWNGVILREKNTVKQLQNIYPQYIFRSTLGDFDHHYGVDYEVIDNYKLLCGIQIKPKSYTFDTPYLTRAKTANRRKFQNYSKEFDVPVFTIISKTSGEIINSNDSIEMKILLQ